MASRTLTATLNIRDRLSSRLSRVRAALQRTRDAVQNTSERLRQMGSAISNAASQLRTRFVEGLRSAGGALSKFRSKVLEAFKTSPIGMFGGKLAALAAGFASIATAAGILKSTIGGAMKIEQEQVAMEHFIGLNNPKDQAKQLTDDYLKYLRQNANETPFETGEVISAGRRSVNITGGDINQAKQLLTIAENMAALNPGKTVMDAMEALADMKVGETERMKEFGFKISQDDLKKAGGGDVGKGAMTLMTTKVAKTFDGGASKLAQTGAGMMSTIVGTIQSSLTDMGFKALDKLKPHMQKIIDFFNAGGLDGIVKFGSDALGQFVDGLAYAFDVVKKILPSIKGLFQANIQTVGPIWQTIGQEVMKIVDIFIEAWPQLSQTLQTGVKAMQPFYTALKDAIKAIGAAVQIVLPIILDIFNAVFPILASWMGKLGTVISALINNVVMPLLPVLGAVLSDVWETIKPILGPLNTLFNVIMDSILNMINNVVVPLLPLLGIVIQNAWDNLKGPLQFMIDMFTSLVNILSTVSSVGSKAMEWTGGVVGKVTSFVGNAYEKGKDIATGHAGGLDYVPYDGYYARLHKGERVLTADENKRGSNGSSHSVNIAKLADHIIIREDADIEKIAKALAKEIRLAGGMM